MVGISVKNFSIAFGNTQILEDVSFEVKAGEIFTILGPSGCGKSTILRSIASLQDKFQGNITLNETCSLTDSNKCHKDIGYIFQDYALFPHLNVQENIEFALDNLKKTERQRRLDKLLTQFDLVEHRHKQIHELSGGQQQRVSIARVIAYEPKVLLLDEPFANLDSLLRNKTKKWLKSLIKELGLSAILVTHDQKEALSMSDKIAIINNKTIEQVGTPHTLFNEPKSLYIAKFLGEINILPSQIANSIDLEIQNNEKLIIRTNKTKLTNTKNDLPLSIKDISYCGEYNELELYFEDFPSQVLTTKLYHHNELSLDEKLYLEINKKEVMIIKE